MNHPPETAVLSLQEVLERAAADLNAGRPAAAADLLDQLLTALPEEAAAHGLAARAAWALGNWRGAEAHFHAALALAPDRRQSLLDLIHWHLRDGRRDAGSAMLLRAWSLDPAPPAPAATDTDIGESYLAALAGGRVQAHRRRPLPGVTLVCVDGINHHLALTALRHCLAWIEPEACLFLTDRALSLPDPDIAVRAVSPLDSAAGYSLVLLHGLQDFVATPHALIVQYDGLLWRPDLWQPDFLGVDYIGAPWGFQADPASSVGNGGFSLRSRKLLQALQDPAITFVHPEDVAICVKHRRHLIEAHGIVFADRALAAAFAVENADPLLPLSGRNSFGFHGLHNFADFFDDGQIDRFAEQMPDRLAASARIFDLAFRLLVSGRRAAAARLAQTVRARVPAAAVSQTLGRLLAFG